MPKESTVIYAGTFRRTMDAKNRVTVPSDWLTDGEPAYFVLPAKENLNVMGPDELARQEDRLRGILSEGRELQQALRTLYGSARKVEPDKQGRILLPEELCKHAQLSAEVVFVGVKNRFEIWSAAKRSSAAEETPDLPPNVQNALEALGY